jgi:chromosome segregation ATPase
MADLPKIIETVVSGLLAGGASAGTTLLAFSRDIKKRLTELESKLGSSEDPKTGLFHSVWVVEEGFKRLKRDVENWEDDPPEWAKRLVSRTRTNSAMGLDHMLEVEQRLDQKIRTFNDRIKGYEDELEEVAKRVKTLEADEQPNVGKVVTRDEYEKDSKSKAEELLKIRESLATANGLLRGVMAAMGYLDDKKDPRTR